MSTLAVKVRSLKMIPQNGQPNTYIHIGRFESIVMKGDLVAQSVTHTSTASLLHLVRPGVCVHQMHVYVDFYYNSAGTKEIVDNAFIQGGFA